MNVHCTLLVWFGEVYRGYTDDASRQRTQENGRFERYSHDIPFRTRQTMYVYLHSNFDSLYHDRYSQQYRNKSILMLRCYVPTLNHYC